MRALASIWARLLSVQMNHTPGLYVDPGVYLGPASISTYESYPRPVCGPRRLTGVRLLSVQMNHTPGLYAARRLSGPGFYLYK